MVEDNAKAILEERYLEIRRREGRLLDDPAVRALPRVPKSSPYFHEWKMRARSLQRLTRYLQQHRQERLAILDLGCGNGWMANRLAENPQWQVIAIDVNRHELAQAERLFARANLHFHPLDLEQPEAWAQQPLRSNAQGFDVVILAASAQYFPDLSALVAILRKLMAENAEIHIIDTPFYKNEAERQAAQGRSALYYASMGVPEMAAHYHHRLWAEAQQLSAVNLNSSLIVKALQKIGYYAPFPWVRIK